MATCEGVEESPTGEGVAKDQRGGKKQKRKGGKKKDVRHAHSTGEKENVHQRNASQLLKRGMVKNKGSDYVANGGGNGK